jgi:wobble nucleotide-excising tRNase
MTNNDDRGPLDLERQIDDKTAHIKKLCAEIGNLEYQITDYQQIVKELSDRLSNYETLHGTILKKTDK